jgi:hypothetical protein
MRIKHRIPSIFNLSMVDVLCCALGCVIFLWLLNLRAVKQSAAAAGRTGAELAATRKLLDEARTRATAQSAARGAAERDRDTARARLASLDRTISGLRADATAAEKTIAGLRAENAAALERLAKKTQEQRDLARKMADTRQRLGALESMLEEKEKLLANSTRRADDLDSRLSDAENRAKKQQMLADLVPGLREEVQRYRTRLGAALERSEALERDIASRRRELAARERDLDDASRRLEMAQGDKRTLAGELARLRESADNRFAGINLTGRRVVFLVDMSGSMELVDEKTPAPEKWIGVRQTLAKILKSLPDLEKFQVILFAERTSYLLGGEGYWLTYNPQTSLDQVTRALAAITPTGSTDLSAAFEAAFRYRSQGLDTIYILSDGLPNVGAGLDPATSAALKDTERAEILGNYVRRALKTDWNRPLAGRRVRINAIGFFYESPDVGAFLWALARENEGSFVGMSKP